MPEAIPFVLWSWVPITLLLFWKLAPARAAALSLVGGWLFLPTARFADDVAGVAFPYWIMPACLPSDYWTTKARVIGVALSLGVMAFDPKVWLRFRPSFFDLPILGWCLVPLVSGLANSLYPTEALANLVYQTLAWGVPYLIGRLYFFNPAGLEILAREIVGGGLAYLPLCAIEFVIGPRFYEILYGFQPYRTQGMVRYLGYRPIVFLEDGNELGIWLAASGLTASWLWRSGQLSKFWGVPGWLVVSLLMGQAILSQSAGAVFLLVVGLATLEYLRWAERTWPLIAIGVVLLALIGGRATNLFDAKALAMKTSLGRRLIDTSVKLDRRSFGWRLRVEERAAKVALQRPVLGWGRWDWWRLGLEGERPWGLVSLALGMYGAVGWALLLACFVVPIAAFLGTGPPRFWTTPTRASAAALTGALAIVGLDAILNPGLFLPFLSAAGGLVGLHSHAKAASAWIRRAQTTLNVR
jgi:O-Antigen ligase